MLPVVIFSILSINRFLDHVLAALVQIGSFTSLHTCVDIVKLLLGRIEMLCELAVAPVKIYKNLQGLHDRTAPQGDNVLHDPAPLNQTVDQACAFLRHFSTEGCDQPIPFDLTFGDPDLDAPFTIAELTVASRLLALLLLTLIKSYH